VDADAIASIRRRLRIPVEVLACPESRLPLELVGVEEAEAQIGRPLSARPGTPFGRTATVLLRSDMAGAYPVLEQGIPILLAPEMLFPSGSARHFDLAAPQYAEAYAEMSHYDALGEKQRRAVEAEGLHELERSSHGLRSVAAVAGLDSRARRAFPEPENVWVDAPYDGLAQRDAYRHLAPIAGQRAMQLGGIGLHAVKFLLGGATEAVVVSPMPGELLFASHLAERYDVGDRLGLVVAVAEELPLVGESLDVIYSGGSVHHMETSLALPECARVLRSGGRFAAVDPWRAPFYAFGTRMFGKREEEVFCRPLTQARVAPLFAAFDEARIVQHGTFTRYPMIALGKLGAVPGPRFLRVAGAVDDRLASVLRMRRFGSSVALLAQAR
jgi:uncharacterized protein YbaR (Trm112 family)/SAM-dependent methyltransferase